MSANGRSGSTVASCALSSDVDGPACGSALRTVTLVNGSANCS